MMRHSTGYNGFTAVLKGEQKLKPSRFFLLLLTSVFLITFIPPVLAAGVKVEICHFPPGNPDNAHTITVSEKALASHLAKHGDFLGACDPQACEDDNNKCTIDIDPVTLECFPIGTRPTVDCNDSSACTTDSCDTNSGCQNVLTCAANADACEVPICALGPELVCGTGECILIPKTCAENEICDPSTGCVPDPTLQCTTDSDCQGDGLFCNGPETCQSGTCVSSGDPCIDPEVCDEADDSCTPTETQSLVFVTAGLFDGNLGGLAGADQKCQTEAAAAGLPGNYKAWLSTDAANSPATRFSQNPIGYKLVNGNEVATSYADLTDGNILTPISRTASGVDVTFDVFPIAWTYTFPDGNASMANENLEPGEISLSCEGWTTADTPSQNPNGTFPLSGIIGSIGATDLRWTGDPDGGPQGSGSPTPVPCGGGSLARLYCFQQ